MNPLEPISTIEFNALVQAHLAMAMHELKNKPKNIMPVLAIAAVDADGKRSTVICAIASNFNGHEEKNAILTMLGRQVYERQTFPLAVALMSEAWLSNTRGTEPRHAKDRREVILVAAADITRTMATVTTIPITRTADNCMVLAAGQSDDGKDLAGLRFPLLDKFYNGFLDAMKGGPPA